MRPPPCCALHLPQASSAATSQPSAVVSQPTKVVSAMRMTEESVMGLGELVMMPRSARAAGHRAAVVPSAAPERDTTSESETPGRRPRS